MPARPSDLAQSLPTVLGTRSSDRAAELEGEVVCLYDEHRVRLLHYVRAFGITGQDGEEIVQEVFLLLFRHLSDGKSRSNLRGWIFRVAHNLALKRRRANQRWHPSLEAQEEAANLPHDPSPSPEELALSAHRRRRLLSIVDALPEQDRLCFTLRAEGLRYREIAHVLGISLGAVSLSLTRSMARLMRADEMV